MSVWAKFLDLLAQSVIVQGVLTIMVVGTLCYLYIAEKAAPEVLVTFASLILGYWFGTKNQLALARQHQEAQNAGKR